MYVYESVCAFFPDSYDNLSVLNVIILTLFQLKNGNKRLVETLENKNSTNTKRQMVLCVLELKFYACK